MPALPASLIEPIRGEFAALLPARLEADPTHPAARAEDAGADLGPPSETPLLC